MQPCERIGACADCQAECVMNRELTEIPGDVTGATLAETETDIAAMFCPALAILARHGTSPPAPANMVRPVLCGRQVLCF